MEDWTSGYVSDIPYTYGYYNELNPLRVRFAFLNNGYYPPETGAACELGFGQGLSINIHAAASSTDWSGTDFNPVQAGFARELAAASGAGARIFDDAFAEFCARQDLPDFDFIGLHGIWSWISEENRTIIVDFVRRKLKVGGVLYISYNTMPGWAAFAPVRHLLNEHANAVGSEGSGIVSRVNGALDFVADLMKINPAYAQINPQIVNRIEALASDNRHYLAHEYFNRDWEPMHFATMAKWLTSAKLTFACSANYIDSVDTVNLTKDQIAFLGSVSDPIFRETVRDFLINQQFRRDYWVKGLRRISPVQRDELLGAQRILLTTEIDDVPKTIRGVLGIVPFNPEVVLPILKLLDSRQSRTVGELVQELSGKVSRGSLMEALMLLAGSGHLTVVQDEEAVAAAKPNTERLNAILMSKARDSEDVNYLASPVTGSGIMVRRMEQLFLLGAAQGTVKPSNLAKFVWGILELQGQSLIKNGKILEGQKENIEELTNMAVEFIKRRMPFLKSLQVV